MSERPPPALLDLLRAAGLPPAAAGQLRHVLGAAAPARLAEDPWVLLTVPGVRPEQADALARAHLGSAARPEDPRRSRAIVAWLLERAARDGHTAVPASVVRSVLAGYAVEDVDSALAAALGDGDVMAFETDAGTDTGDGAEGEAGGAVGDHVLALERHALSEESLADSLCRLLATAQRPTVDDVDAATAVLVHGVGAVAAAEGAPTATTLRRLAAAAERLGTVAVRTPATCTSAPEAEVLILGDAHLLDLELAAALGEAVPDGGRLVLVGDPDQLPPRGAGSPFLDLLACGSVAVGESGVPPAGVLETLAAAVRDGTLPPVTAPGREAVVVPAAGSGEAVHRAVQLVADSIPRALGIPPAEVMVVAPARGGAGGVRALNRALKAAVNPGPGEFAGFDVGDRVMARASHGEYGLTPGQGAVVAGKSAAGLVLTAGDQRLEVPIERADDLIHGWATTVHEARGRRWPAVVAVLPGEAAGMLSRPLVYTAFTRAERHLSVVAAAGRALGHAVARVPGRPRRTRLAGLLRNPR